MDKNTRKKFDQYVKACKYPGIIDPEKVEYHLRAYLKTLNIDRQVVQIKRGWKLEDYPSLKRNVELILIEVSKNRAAIDARAAIAARDASDARDAIAASAASAARDAIAARDARAASAASDAIAARDASDARDEAIMKFARWCLYRSSWWWYRWELSWISSIYFGATQIKSDQVKKWSGQILDSFLNGGWSMYWTDDTLYWIAKPVVKVDIDRRLHNESGPALACDIEDLYFWQGVLVDEQIIMRPETLTVSQINAEENAEVRRIMMLRYGWDKWLREVDARLINQDVDPTIGALYEFNDQDGVAVRVLKCQNGTPEYDGLFGKEVYREFFLRVPVNGIKTALDANRWTYPIARSLSDADYREWNKARA